MVVAGVGLMLRGCSGAFEDAVGPGEAQLSFCSHANLREAEGCGERSIRHYRCEAVPRVYF